MALKHVLYHIQNELPVQVECRIQEAWSCCCTGMTQRDGMGWEVGGGGQDGEHVYSHGGFILIWQNQYNIVNLK